MRGLASLRTTLGVVAAALASASARDDWWVIGSAAVTLHGSAPVAVQDIDVLLSAHDAGNVLPALGLPVAPGVGNAHFRSAIFATCHMAELPIEFMAGLQYCVRGEWRTLVPATRERIVLDGANLFVPAYGELRDILLAFGRPKDLVRAKLLDAVA